MDKFISLIFAIGVLAAGGYAIAKTLHHNKKVAPAIQRQMQLAVARREPGAAVTSTSCGSSTCTIYVRKGATHSCDGWMASLDENGGVALIGVGKKSC